VPTKQSLNLRPMVEARNVSFRLIPTHEALRILLSGFAPVCYADYKTGNYVQVFTNVRTLYEQKGIEPAQPCEMSFSDALKRAWWIMESNSG
jgi:hypothetical protein